ncbi:MAG TPA: hypothetical protein VKX17_25925, partial [Planctomycetota bacterium]|nr:hypothetical protein [Planctomycetota bacterium]
NATTVHAAYSNCSLTTARASPTPHSNAPFTPLHISTPPHRMATGSIHWIEKMQGALQAFQAQTEMILPAFRPNERKAGATNPLYQ